MGSNQVITDSYSITHRPKLEQRVNTRGNEDGVILKSAKKQSRLGPIDLLVRSFVEEK